MLRSACTDGPTGPNCLTDDYIQAHGYKKEGSSLMYICPIPTEPERGIRQTPELQLLYLSATHLCGPWKNNLRYKVREFDPAAFDCLPVTRKVSSSTLRRRVCLVELPREAGKTSCDAGGELACGFCHFDAHLSAL